MKPLDELFLEWLYMQVADIETREPSKSFWKLIRHLYSTEAYWLIPNDENRLEDGKDLRLAFQRECSVEVIDQNWLDLPCSVLELMVGLSQKLSFEAGRGPHYWFWVIAHNIGIDVYNDARRFPKKHVSIIIDRVLDRTYEADGYGGFFPLKHPDQDQRLVELWYQLSAYVLEMG